MTRGILVAGIESPLQAAMGAEAGKREGTYAAAVVPNHFAPPVRESAAGDGAVSLEWNPASPLSARALVLAAENRLEHLDLAILVCAPPSLRRPPEQLAPADIETAVNNYIKGWFFLVREIAACFMGRKDTDPPDALALVLSEYRPGAEKGEIADLAGPPVAAAFRALAQGIAVSEAGRPWQSYMFSSDLAEDREFAAFVFKTIEEGGKRASGKWHKYGRFLPFGGPRMGGR